MPQVGRAGGGARSWLCDLAAPPAVIPRWRFDVVLDRFRLWRLAAGDQPAAWGHFLRALACAGRHRFGDRAAGQRLVGTGTGGLDGRRQPFGGHARRATSIVLAHRLQGRAHRGGRARILGGFAGRNQGRRSVEQGPPEGATQLQAERRQIAELVTSLVPAHRREYDCLSFRSCFSALVLCGCGSSSRVTCARLTCIAL